MADIELVVKIPEGLKKDFELEQWTALSCMEMKDALMNGTPLDKHDEEVIAETVESIWGKPPYRDILEKIRDEILKLDDADYDFEGYYKAVTDALAIIDKYRGESDCRECKAEHDCYECKKYVESEE